MQRPPFVRFVVTSYPYLQGLTAVPVGAALTAAALWANALDRRATPLDLLLVTALVAGLLGLTWPIARYYRRTFGIAERSPQDRRLEAVVGLVAAGLALGATWLDLTASLPFCAYGLVFALVWLATYIKITWPVGGRRLRYYPVAAALVAGLSVLPALGLAGWWTAFGLHTQLLAVMAATGLLIMVTGLWSHFDLTRIMAPASELYHG
jgi:hypothetical protein